MIQSLYVLNLFMLVLNSLGYGLSVSPVPSFSVIMFLITGLFFQMAVLSSMISFLAWGLSIFSQKLMIWAQIILFGMFHILVFMDWNIFRMFRFHINGLVWDLLSSPSGFAALNVPLHIVVIGLVLAASIFAMELMVSSHVRRRMVQKKPLFIRWKHWHIVTIVIVTGIVNSSMYIFADATDNDSIRFSSRIIPAYLPIEVKTYTASLFRGQVAPNADSKPPSSAQLLKYPKVPARFSSKLKDLGRQNIILIVLDSVRHDMIQDEFMPATAKFSRGAMKFENHWSGGNATRHGIFSMFYGIYGSYWKPFLNVKQEPFLMSVLRQQGYDIGIMSSAKLDYPEFISTIFSKINASQIHDTHTQPTPAERDQEATEQFTKYITEYPADKPFFGMLFLDSAHGPYSYDKAHDKFQPTGQLDYFLTLSKEAQRQRLFNSYKNAIGFLDSQIKTVLDALKKSTLAKNTIVIITSDHGEEFYEHGYRGHFSAYTPEQVHVPMIVLDQTLGAGTHNGMTSHHGLAPGLLKKLGVANEADFGLATNLFERPNEKYVVACSWDDCALIDRDGVVVFGTEPYNLFKKTYYDREYKEVSGKDLPDRVSKLFEVINGMSEFYR